MRTGATDTALDVYRYAYQPLDPIFSPRSVAVIGATERQVIYDVVFRNDSKHDLLAAAFVWTALDEDGKLVYRRMSNYSGTPVPPGRIQQLHELDVMIAGNVARYELPVLKTEFADGSLCDVKLSDVAKR